jgi:putative Mg2+ transporter-C (MgtC) family protein
MLNEIANAHGYDIASGTISITRNDDAYEWNFVAVARSRQKMGPLSELAHEISQYQGVDSFHVSFARN